MVEWGSDATPLGVVKPGSFRPPPKVTSQFVGLERKSSRGAAEEYVRVLEVAGLAFTHRRKTLANSLRAGFNPGHVAAWCEAAGYDRTVRPENLSLADFRSLTAHLLSSRSSQST